MERLEAKIDKLEALIKGQIVALTPCHPLKTERKSSGPLPNAAGAALSRRRRRRGNEPGTHAFRTTVQINVSCFRCIQFSKYFNTAHHVSGVRPAFSSSLSESTPVGRSAAGAAGSARGWARATADAAAAAASSSGG